MSSLPSTLADGLTPDARRYAIWELARRAGVGREEFQHWRLDIGAAETLVFPLRGSAACIRFPHYPREYWQSPTGLPHVLARLGWMSCPAASVLRLVPHFIVPFAPPHVDDDGPLFRIDAMGTAECAVDLPAVIFCALTRIEEVVNPRRDRHGRFPSDESVAVREEFLHRPFVDEYGLAFEQVLQSLLPGWQSRRPHMRCLISQDVDHIGIPFRLSKTIGHTVRRRKPADSLRDFGSWFGMQPAWLRCVSNVANEATSRGLPAAVYWKATTRVTQWDTGYDPRDPRIQRVVSALRESGAELGVHPGYFTYGDLKSLSDEVAILRQALGDGPLGGRQHFLRWSPASWEHWEQCGLAYDSSVGYSDRVGFRAGTCHPYNPWLLARNRQADLLEIPLVIMDVAITGSYGPNEADLRALVGDLVNRCRLVGGVMTVLWHNSTYNEVLARRICTYTLDLLSDGANIADVCSDAVAAHA